MSESEIVLRKSWPVAKGDFAQAGDVSGHIKKLLKQLGVDSSLVRRIAIVCYEVELNLVIHSEGGHMFLDMSDAAITIRAEDQGPGIADIQMAMTEGFSTASDDVRMMGFGAGMGLPNMARNADDFDIQSAPGVGTRITMTFTI